jgi:hypothetical protein
MALLLVGSTAAGCVTQSGLPDDCGAANVERQASLDGERLSPESIDVCKGQHVTLDITTQRAGELHLHGYDEEAPEIEVEVGDTAHFDFTAVRSGQFMVELHSADGTEAEVGVFTVHEP